MIFVVVGLHQQGFDRLVNMMDQISATTNERVIIQLGNTARSPRFSESFHFKDNQSIAELYMSADIVVTHGGVGSIMTALAYGKPVIVVPRLSKYGEHVNDHQLDIANAFSKLGFVLTASDLDELSERISSVKDGTATLRSYNFGQERTKLAKFISVYLHKLERSKMIGNGA